MSQPSKTVIHVTHEAARKVGGIGAVLDGMLTSGPYRQGVSRSILVAPLFTTEDGISERLGPDGDVLYSSLDGLTKNQYASSLAKVERKYKVNIVYGLLGFVIFEFLLAFGIGASSKGLQRLVDRGRQQLARTNVRLKEEVAHRRESEKEKEHLISELQEALGPAPSPS